MKPPAIGLVAAEWTSVFLLVTAGPTTVTADATPPPQPALAIGVAAPVDPGPSIRFAAPVHDFGQVTGGEVARHEFVFTNVGERLLEISDVRSSCGCTTAGTWSRQVEPGMTGTIPIELHTEDFTGPIEKPITVTCNDASQPVVTLLIRCTVWHPIEISPSSAVFKVFPDAPSNAFAVVRIVNNLAEPLTLFPPESSHRALAAELSTNQPGREFQLVIKMVPPVGAGNVFGRVTLRTASSEVPTLVVPVFALIQDAVTATPSQITLPAGPLALDLTQVVSIRSAWTNPLTVSTPALNAKGVGVELKELDPGRCFTVTLTFPQGFDIAPTQKVALRATSNHPQFPTIRVPVVQPARPASASRQDPP